MGERQDALQQYVSDMLALERHILEALERQSGDARVETMPEASRVIRAIEQMNRSHVGELEGHLGRLGGDAFAPVKEAVTAILGVAAGLYDKVRPDAVSKMLRDDYTALSLAAISYTMLHTTGLALNDQATADLALRNLRDITPKIVEISEVIPLVVARELADVGEMVDTSVGPAAVRNTQQLWSREVVEQAF
jgi:hypothetical protein